MDHVGQNDRTVVRSQHALVTVVLQHVLGVLPEAMEHSCILAGLEFGRDQQEAVPSHRLFLPERNLEHRVADALLTAQRDELRRRRGDGVQVA